MKKIFVTILAALCFCMAARAVPAYKGLIPYKQPDGSTIMIRLHGDEFFHWVTDANGNYLEEDGDGFYRPGSASRLSTRRAAADIRRTAMNEARRSAAKRGVASGQKHFLVILVEFSDVKFTYTKEDFEKLLNQDGYSVNGGTGSAKDFYYQNSGGLFEPVFDVYGPVTLTSSVSYYGGNNSSGDDIRPHYAVRDGCNGLNSQINFSQYDNDSDGAVDLVFMYYAGKGEADGGGSNTIWPHQWELSSGGINLTLDGKKIDKYACTNEIVNYGALSGKLCGIGTACHEFGHAMGLPDFYDTDYDDNGEAGALYEYSPMCGGSYNNGGRTPPYFNMEERILLGWQEPSAISEFPRSGTYSLASVNNNVAYKTATDMDGEYFLYECRAKTGWDAYIPEAGMIVYHVDKSSRNVSIYNYGSVKASQLWSDWERTNSINENGSHPCFYIVPAGSQSSLNYPGSRFAFPGQSGSRVTYFTATSWNGVASEVQLSNISFSGNIVTLYATVPQVTLNYNVIANPGNGVYLSGSNFTLDLEESDTQPVSSVAWFFDDEPVSVPSVRLSSGFHVVEAHLTLTDGSTQIVSLTIEAR